MKIETIPTPLTDAATKCAHAFGQNKEVVPVEIAKRLEVERAIWQPIETAPKDGTSILVWDGCRMAVASWQFTSLWKTCKDWTIGECSGEYNSFETVDGPTHWMSLPPAPTAP